MIERLLVANRGEIARRVFRTCRSMGITPLAVFSTADRGSPFVREADEAVEVGGEAPADSYLRVDAVVSAALRLRADAVHPGYGFLAENPALARAVTEAGILWVGPPEKAIATMGSKLASKRLAEASGVPTLPSVEVEPATSPGDAASALGFPLLVKASAGGGGKGMRMVRSPDELDEAVAGARRESASAFGDDTVFLEPYLERARHVEIQVLADAHGNTVSLFERDCSIQRRHQKIVEESPSPALTPALREEMGAAAVRLAEAVGYLGAGTVEFLLDGDRFFFLEMNTRLQVEHPVTEAVTGLDLVRLQLVVAEGRSLPPEALAPPLRGHAIEARLYAEDPRRDFVPATGTVTRFSVPSGVRVDAGVEDGTVVTVHYDPMLAKVIAWAETREEAAATLTGALRHAEVHGVTTNRDLLVRILTHPEFLAGDADTRFLERHDPAELGRPLPDPAEERLAAVAAALALREARSPVVLPGLQPGWRNNPSQRQTVVFDGEQGPIEVGYLAGRRGGLEVAVGGETLGRVEVAGSASGRIGLAVDGHLGWYRVRRDGPVHDLTAPVVHHVDGPAGYSRLVQRPRFPPGVPDEEPGSLHAPMPGRVVAVHVTEGDRVEEGQPLLVVEAMKMEHALRAPISGVVMAVRTDLGAQVEADEVLVVVDEG